MARPKRERKLTKRALVAQQQSELDLGEDPLLGRRGLVSRCHQSADSAPEAGSDDVGDDSEVYIPARKYPRTSKTSRSKGLEKGSLRNIMTMPIDIFAQIALYLLPVDIMNLSRTTKSLRGLLMQRPSAHIWRGAAWNVPELPPCPSYLSEPKYFSLIYSKTCSTCGTAITRSMDAYLLVRLCTPCRNDAIIRAQDLEMHIRVIIPMSFGIVSLHDKTMDYGVYSLRTDVELLEEEHQQLKDAGLLGDEGDDYWPEPKRTAFIAREEHSHKLRDFLREMEQLRTMEISKKKRIFRDDVEARLTEMGWEEGDLKFSWRYCREWDMLVNQQRSLTDRIWEGLYPKLEPLLKDNRDRRLADEREERKVERNRAFKKFWLRMGQKCGVYLTERIPNTDVREKVHKFIPPTETVMEWPSLKPILDTDITPEEMKKLVHKDWDKIKRACQEWRSGIEKQLADCLRKDEISREYPAVTPYVLVSGSTKRTLSPDLSLLLRADSVFQYRGMRNPRFFPDVIDSTYFVADRANIMSESWRIESYSPYSAAREAAKELLECLGTPNATYLNMKCRGKRFVCGRCHDIFPKSWESMIMHYVEEKRLWENNQDYIENEESCGITFNNIHDADYETDEPLVRLLTVGEAEEYAESAPAWADKPWLRHEEAYVCSVCNLYGQFDLDGVLAHLRDVHEELEPELGEEYEDYDSYLERRAEEMDEDEYSELEDYGSELLDGVIGLFGAYLGLPPFQ